MKHRLTVWKFAFFLNSTIRLQFVKYVSLLISLWFFLLFISILFQVPHHVHFIKVIEKPCDLNKSRGLFEDAISAEKKRVNVAPVTRSFSSSSSSSSLCLPFPSQPSIFYARKFFTLVRNFLIGQCQNNNNDDSRIDNDNNNSINTRMYNGCNCLIG